MRQELNTRFWPLRVLTAGPPWAPPYLRTSSTSTSTSTSCTSTRTSTPSRPFPLRSRPHRHHASSGSAMGSTPASMGGQERRGGGALPCNPVGPSELQTGWGSLGLARLWDAPAPGGTDRGLSRSSFPRPAILKLWVVSHSRCSPRRSNPVCGG